MNYKYGLYPPTPRWLEDENDAVVYLPNETKVGYVDEELVLTKSQVYATQILEIGQILEDMAIEMMENNPCDKKLKVMLGEVSTIAELNPR